MESELALCFPYKGKRFLYTVALFNFTRITLSHNSMCQALYRLLLLPLHLCVRARARLCVCPRGRVCISCCHYFDVSLPQLNHKLQGLFVCLLLVSSI